MMEKALTTISCDQSAVTKEKKWIDSNSYVELKFSTTCKTAWAKLL